jgi:hypothetical protein
MFRKPLEIFHTEFYTWHIFLALIILIEPNEQTQTEYNIWLDKYTSMTKNVNSQEIQFLVNNIQI